ncbi:MAG: nucleotide exchange factor GrpE [Parcubacteria group bacterium]
MSEENQEDFSIDPEPEQARYGAGEEELDDSVVAEEAQGASIKKLRERLKESEEKAKEYLDSWQRSQADFVNLRKRDEEGKKEFVKFAGESLVKELIPVLDSFNIALSQGHNEMEPVYSQLLKVLRANGLEELDPKGASFDPSLHEAITMIPTEKAEEDHKVLEVMQKGYALHGKVVRPAKVAVGEYK